MNKLLKQPLNLLFLLLLLACNGKNNISSLLSEAERCMSEQPDSALLLLNSVQHPEDLSRKNQALWCLLYTQAQDKNYVEHTSDSLINIAVDYFSKKKDQHRKAQAYYCQGRVLSDLNVSDEALEAYLSALDAVRQTSDYELKARICNHLGGLYWRNRDDEKSLFYYKEAWWAYETSGSPLGVVNTMRSIGVCMHSLGRLDSAFIYFDKALQWARQEEVISQIAYLYSSLGNLYEEQGKYQEALAYIKESLKYLEKENSLSSQYYSIAKLFQNMQQPDSATYYAEKALTGTELYVKCSVNRLLYELSFANRNYEKAYIYNETYLSLRDSIENIYQPQQLTKIESLYNKERLINKQNKEKERLYRRNVFLSAIICVISILGLFFYNEERKKRKEQQLKLKKYQEQLDNVFSELEKKALLFKEKEASLNEYHRLKQQNEKEIADYKEKICQLENNVFEQQKYQNELNDKLEAGNRLLKQINTLAKEQQMLLNEKNALHQHWINLLTQKNPYLYQLMRKPHLHPFSEKDWNEFDENFERVVPGFIDYLDHKYSMDCRQLQICCLLKLGMKNSKISEIYDLKPDTITSLKAEIKKAYFADKGKSSLDNILKNLY